MTWNQTRQLISSDLEQLVRFHGHRPGRLRRLRFALSPSGLAVIIARLERHFFLRGPYFFSKLLAVLNIMLFATEIQPRSEIGGGFVILNPNGVLVHDNARIGANCIFSHQCSVGVKSLEQTVRLEDNVYLGPGARLMGNLTIGRNSLVAPNAVVTKSAPAGSWIAGVPAEAVPVDQAPRACRPGPETAAPQPAGGRPSLRATLALIKADLRRRAWADGFPFSRACYLKVFLNPPALAVTLYRVQCWLAGLGLTPLADGIYLFNLVAFKAGLSSGATVGGGLVLVHTNGVFIEARATVGSNCLLFHHNTIAPAPLAPPTAAGPVVGDEVVFGAGARVVADAAIGSGSKLGMNAVVEATLPEQVVAVGIPARVVRSLAADAGRDGIKPAASEERSQEDDNPTTFRQTLALIREDVQRRNRMEDKPYGLASYLKIPMNPAAAAVVVFRLQHWLFGRGHRWLAKILSNINKSCYSVEIFSPARIGGGLVLAHACGILVHGNCRIGKNCTFTFLNSLTTAYRDNEDHANDRLVIGDNVLIGGGAKLLGNLTVGEGSSIGLNSVVLRSAAANSVLAGIPARDLKQNTP